TGNVLLDLLSTHSPLTYIWYVRTSVFTPAGMATSINWPSFAQPDTTSFFLLARARRPRLHHYSWSCAVDRQKRKVLRARRRLRFPRTSIHHMRADTCFAAREKIPAQCRERSYEIRIIRRPLASVFLSRL